jgi:predicted nucleic acid-binding protein
MRYVLDCCAWHCLRGLKFGSCSLLQCLLDADSSFLPLALTEFVARNELSPVLAQIQSEAKNGRVVVHSISRRDPNYKRLERVTDKGEAEMITWLLTLRKQDRPLFVSRDAGARRAAKNEGLFQTDVLGLVVDMLVIGCLLEPQAMEALSIWDDKSQQQCRPADWEGLATIASRRARGYPFMPA